MTPLNVSINNNILTYNNTTIVMDKKIIDYVIISEYVILLEEYTGDGDYNLVHCFDARNLNKLWKIKTPEKRFIGETLYPYVGLGITRGLTVVDMLGRFFILDIKTGETIDMFCRRF